MDDGRQEKPILDRPVRSLLDIKIGTPDEYGSVQTGARLDAVRGRFGKPATTGHNPFDAVSGDTQNCLGYRSSALELLFLFCFEAGRLVDERTL